jgi:hypothetical protein
MPILAKPTPTTSFKAWDSLRWIGRVPSLVLQRRTEEGKKVNATFAHKIFYSETDLRNYRIIYFSTAADDRESNVVGDVTSGQIPMTYGKHSSRDAVVRHNLAKDDQRIVLATGDTEQEIMKDWEDIRLAARRTKKKSFDLAKWDEIVAAVSAERIQSAAAAARPVKSAKRVKFLDQNFSDQWSAAREADSASTAYNEPSFPDDASDAEAFPATEEDEEQLAASVQRGPNHALISPSSVESKRPSSVLVAAGGAAAVLLTALLAMTDMFEGTWSTSVLVVMASAFLLAGLLSTKFFVWLTRARLILPLHVLKVSEAEERRSITMLWEQALLPFVVIREEINARTSVTRDETRCRSATDDLRHFSLNSVVPLVEDEQHIRQRIRDAQRLQISISAALFRNARHQLEVMLGESSRRQEIARSERNEFFIVVEKRFADYSKPLFTAEAKLRMTVQLDEKYAWQALQGLASQSFVNAARNARQRAPLRKVSDRAHEDWQFLVERERTARVRLLARFASDGALAAQRTEVAILEANEARVRLEGVLQEERCELLALLQVTAREFRAAQAAEVVLLEASHDKRRQRVQAEEDDARMQLLDSAQYNFLAVLAAGQQAAAVREMLVCEDRRRADMELQESMERGGLEAAIANAAAVCRILLQLAQTAADEFETRLSISESEVALVSVLFLAEGACRLATEQRRTLILKEERLRQEIAVSQTEEIVLIEQNVAASRVLAERTASARLQLRSLEDREGDLRRTAVAEVEKAQRHRLSDLLELHLLEVHEAVARRETIVFSWMTSVAKLVEYAIHSRCAVVAARDQLNLFAAESNARTILDDSAATAWTVLAAQRRIDEAVVMVRDAESRYRRFTAELEAVSRRAFFVESVDVARKEHFERHAVLLPLCKMIMVQSHEAETRRANEARQGEELGAISTLFAASFVIAIFRFSCRRMMENEAAVRLQIAHQEECLRAGPVLDSAKHSWDEALFRARRREVSEAESAARRDSVVHEEALEWHRMVVTRLAASRDEAIQAAHFRSQRELFVGQESAARRQNLLDPEQCSWDRDIAAACLVSQRRAALLVKQRDIRVSFLAEEASFRERIAVLDESTDRHELLKAAAAAAFHSKILTATRLLTTQELECRLDVAGEADVACTALFRTERRFFLQVQEKGGRAAVISLEAAEFFACNAASCESVAEASHRLVRRHAEELSHVCVEESGGRQLIDELRDDDWNVVSAVAAAAVLQLLDEPRQRLALSTACARELRSIIAGLPPAVVGTLVLPMRLGGLVCPRSCASVPEESEETFSLSALLRGQHRQTRGVSMVMEPVIAPLLFADEGPNDALPAPVPSNESDEQVLPNITPADELDGLLARCLLLSEGPFSAVYAAVNPETGVQTEIIKLLIPPSAGASSLSTGETNERAAALIFQRYLCHVSRRMEDEESAQQQATMLSQHSMTSLNACLPLPKTMLADTRGRVAFQLEPLQGEYASLADVVAFSPPPPPAQLLAVMSSLLSVLRSLHSKGLAHGAISLSNVLVTADGSLLLIDGLGISSCALVARQDFSTVSPRQMRLLCRLARSLRSFSSDETLFYRLWLACIDQGMPGDVRKGLQDDKAEMMADAGDDLYAAATVLQSLVHGFPRLHGDDLHALAILPSRQGKVPVPCASFVDPAIPVMIDEALALSRGYSPSFVAQCQDLIDELTSYSGVPQPNAEPGFGFPEATRLAPLIEQLRPSPELLRSLAEEAYRATTRCNRASGSIPVNLHLMRNSLLGLAKRDYLKSRGECNAMVSHVLFPPVSESGAERTLLTGRSPAECSSGDIPGMRCVSLQRPSSAAAADIVVVFSGSDPIELREQDVLSFIRRSGDPARTRVASTADVTAILSGLSDASVSLMCPFRCVLLVDVQRCVVELGPCDVCLIGGTSLTHVSVASHLILLEHLTDSTVAYHGDAEPVALDPNEVSGVTLVPYDVSYQGLTQHFQQMHIAEEHINTLLQYPDEEMVLMGHRQPLKLLPRADPAALGHEYPFLRSMKHREGILRIDRLGASLSEGRLVCYLPGEIRDFSIIIEGLHSMDPGARHVIVLLDLVSDVLIRECSGISVMIACATAHVVCEDLSNSRLIICTEALVLQNCSALEVHAYAATSATVSHGCHTVSITPLYFEGPFLDILLDGWRPDAAPAKNVVGSPKMVVSSDSQRIAKDSSCSVIFDWTIGTHHLGPSGRRLSKSALAARKTPRLSLPQFLMGDSGGPSRPTTVSFANLNGPSLCRGLGMATILSPPVSSLSAQAQQLPDVVIEFVSTGSIHLVDAIGTLIVRNCSGPLEVACFAAQRVVLESCVGLQVHLACKEMTISNLKFCMVSFLAEQVLSVDKSSCHHVQFAPLNILLPDRAICTAVMSAIGMDAAAAAKAFAAGLFDAELCGTSQADSERAPWDLPPSISVEPLAPEPLSLVLDEGEMGYSIPELQLQAGRRISAQENSPARVAESLFALIDAVFSV